MVNGDGYLRKTLACLTAALYAQLPHGVKVLNNIKSEARRIERCWRCAPGSELLDFVVHLLKTSDIRVLLFRVSNAAQCYAHNSILQIIIIGAAAHRAAQNKTDKYASLASAHIFCPFAIETAGAWHETAIEVTQEIGRRITVVTEDTRETEFLLQRLSMALERGNAVSFQSTMITE